ncbi:MAG: gliding motility protein GldM, partial [Sphingobacteriales bacterium]
ILQAFKTINDSLETSKNNANTSIEQVLANFEATKAKEDPINNKPLLDKAKQAKAYADELNGYIESIKKQFLQRGNGIDPETNDFKKRDNLDIAQDIMINGKEGIKLKKLINDTREKLISLLKEDQKQGISFSLEAKDPEKRGPKSKSWETLNFGDGIPLTAANTILTKIQNDTKTAEAEVIKKLLSDEPVVILNQFAAVAVAPTSYVIQGQPYTAEVFLTASDSKSDADISVGGSRLGVKDGKGTYVGSTNSVGTFKWVGTIRVKNNKTGKIDEYRTPEQSYQVAKPSSTVSSDNANVVYPGVPNPFSVSAAGFPLESLSASISAGSMRGANGKYQVNVGGDMVGKEVTISVTANNGGKPVSLGSQKFRVKAFPMPKAKVGGKSGGDRSAAQLRSEDGIEADLEDFLFDVKFSIIRYSVTIIKPRQDAVTLSGTGGTFAGPIRNLMNSITPQTTIIFRDIVAQGPDGRQRVLDNVTFFAK